MLSKKFLVIFLLGVLVISIPLFLFPINLFAGEIVYVEGLTEIKVEAPLSLSYFVGMGYNPGDMNGIKNFYLLPKGWITAFVLIFCIPALVTYRFYLKRK